MASSIDASTSGAGGVITTADNTGILQLKSGGTTIATISSTGLALNAGNITLPSTAAPTFSASSSSTLSISHATNTKIPFSIEDWDTNSNYDNSTNYRFTPTVAGYYQVNIKIQLEGTSSGGETYNALYKNGSLHKRVGMTPNIASTQRSPVGSILVYLNGSTDYIEAYVFQNTGGAVALNGDSQLNYFQAFLARAA